MNLAAFGYLAGYNRWINERLYRCCIDVDDASRKQDRGAYFRSIHGTLNHILLADRLWLGRFESKPIQIESLDQELYQDFDELRGARAREDARIENWVAKLDDHRLAIELQFDAVTNPGTSTVIYWQAAMHLFNHQTHHRGQIFTLLSQLGVDTGPTDMIEMPGIVW